MLEYLSVNQSCSVCFVLLRYQYRLYPSPCQRVALAKAFGSPTGGVTSLSRRPPRSSARIKRSTWRT
ncbi:MAG: helix-turn-helix domain-containing protein [Stackebrandtia sp.]